MSDKTVCREAVKNKKFGLVGTKPARGECPSACFMGSDLFASPETGGSRHVDRIYRENNLSEWHTSFLKGRG